MIYTLINEDNKCIEFNKQPTGLVVVQCRINDVITDSFMITFGDAKRLYRAVKKVGFKRLK